MYAIRSYYEALDDFGAIPEDMNIDGDIIGGSKRLNGLDDSIVVLGIPPRTEDGQRFTFSYSYNFV